MQTLFTAWADPCEPPVASVPPDGAGEPSVIFGGAEIRLLEPVGGTAAADWWATFADACGRVSAAYRARANGAT